MTDPQPTQPASSVIGIIPARLASTRLPRKVLRQVAGVPLLVWVYRAAANAGVFRRLIVAADSEEVLDLCRTYGIEARMTSPDLASGTDRLYAVACQLQGTDHDIGPDSILVNIQGDEPLLLPEHFHALLRPLTAHRLPPYHPDAAPAEVSTIRTRCPASEVANPNVVKVVVDRNGRALYFSRAPIPWDRDGSGGIAHWKHLGLYAYRKRILDRFAGLPPGRLEMAERLEQLRLLENGIDIHVEEVASDTVGVDTEEDLAAVEKLIRQRGAASAE